MLRLDIKDGQSYVDKPVEAQPLPIEPIDRLFANLFKRDLPKPIVLGHERVKLRWLRHKDGKIGPR